MLFSYADECPLQKGLPDSSASAPRMRSAGLRPGGWQARNRAGSETGAPAGFAAEVENGVHADCVKLRLRTYALTVLGRSAA